jgi:hypothetical protein
LGRGIATPLSYALVCKIRVSKASTAKKKGQSLKFHREKEGQENPTKTHHIFPSFKVLRQKEGKIQFFMFTVKKKENQIFVSKKLHFCIILRVFVKKKSFGSISKLYTAKKKQKVSF